MVTMALNRAKTGGSSAVEPDASGVHVSSQPRTVEDWRNLLAPIVQGESPEMEALLHAFGRLERRVAHLERRNSALQQGLDRLPVGVVVVQQRRVLAINSVSRQLLESGGLRVDEADALSAETAEGQRELDELFRAVRSAPQKPHAGLVPRSVGPGLEIVLVDGGLALEESVILTLSDPRVIPQVDARVFQKLYGLTPTEAKVATHLVQGRSPRDIARVLGVGVETTRTHVKHILAKLSCHRQVDVVRRLVTGAGLLR